MITSRLQKPGSDAARLFSLRNVVWSLATALVLTACGNDKAGKHQTTESDSTSKQLTSIDCGLLKSLALKNDSILLQETSVNVATASQAIKAFVDFANFCPTDSLSPVFLIKTAQVATAINQIPQAKVVLEKCIRDYPQFTERPAALFLLARLYDETVYLNNENEARVLYEQIINEYPTSTWAMNADAAIGFLGKTDEQILRELKKKSKK